MQPHCAESSTSHLNAGVNRCGHEQINQSSNQNPILKFPTGFTDRSQIEKDKSTLGLMYMFCPIMSHPQDAYTYIHNLDSHVTYNLVSAFDACVAGTHM